VLFRSPGENVKIKVFRDGSYITVDVKVTSRPSSSEIAEKTEGGKPSGDTVEYRGIVVSSNPNGSGVIVVEVKEESDFSGILQKGDVIVEINNKKINNLSDFSEFARQNKDQKRFLIKFYRGNMLIIRGFSTK